MPKEKTLKEKLFGAAVLKVSFVLRAADESPAFKAIYPGVLRDLGLSEAQVDAYVAENREAVEKAARGSTQGDDDED
jgi:4'-phosphopantetheinyl transferase EntD